MTGNVRRGEEVGGPQADRGERPNDHRVPGYLAEPLGRFLERMAAPGPGPTAGAAAAVAGALAAALAELSARLAGRQRPDAPELAERAAALTDRLTRLAAADVAAVSRMLDADPGAAGGSGEPGGAGSPPGETALTAVPLGIAAAAADAAVLAAELAADGNPNLLGDAVTAAMLADAAARSCVVLVGLNVAGSTDEPDTDGPDTDESGPVAEVRRHAFHATAAARAALVNLPEALWPETP